MNAELYETIEDLPLYNWHKIHEKSDYTYLRVRRINGQVSKEEFKKLKKTWDEIFSEYIDRFGFSKEFLSLFEKKKLIAYYQQLFIETLDPSLHTIIAVMELELSQDKPKDTKDNFWSSKALIERLCGFSIDTKKTTVIEFYSQIESLRKDGKLT